MVRPVWYSYNNSHHSRDVAGFVQNYDQREMETVYPLMALKARSWDKTQGLRPNYILNLGAFVNFHIVVFVSPPLLVSENRSHITKTNVPKVQLSTTTVTGRPPKLSQNLDLRYPHAMVMGTVIHCLLSVPTCCWITSQQIIQKFPDAHWIQTKLWSKSQCSSSRNHSLGLLPGQRPQVVW